MEELEIGRRLNPHLDLIELPKSREEQVFSEAVADGLSKPQKNLPCRYFYDLAGSKLFEQICELPEYYLTRTEQKIFEDNSSDIINALGSELAIVEFGSGNSVKTRLLINAALNRQEHLHYIPIDISSLVSCKPPRKRCWVKSINSRLPRSPPNILTPSRLFPTWVDLACFFS